MGDLWANLLILAGLCIAVGGAGIAVLRRKFK
jgi:LPXTG-motif cell wall-anchored protein